MQFAVCFYSVYKHFEIGSRLPRSVDRRSVTAGDQVNRRRLDHGGGVRVQPVSAQFHGRHARSATCDVVPVGRICARFDEHILPSNCLPHVCA